MGVFRVRYAVYVLVIYTPAVSFIPVEKQTPEVRGVPEPSVHPLFPKTSPSSSILSGALNQSAQNTPHQASRVWEVTFATRQTLIQNCRTALSSDQRQLYLFTGATDDVQAKQRAIEIYFGSRTPVRIRDFGVRVWGPLVPNSNQISSRFTPAHTGRVSSKRRSASRNAISCSMLCVWTPQLTTVVSRTLRCVTRCFTSSVWPRR